MGLVYLHLLAQIRDPGSIAFVAVSSQPFTERAQHTMQSAPSLLPLSFFRQGYGVSAASLPLSLSLSLSLRFARGVRQGQSPGPAQARYPIHYFVWMGSAARRGSAGALSGLRKADASGEKNML